MISTFDWDLAMREYCAGRSVAIPWFTPACYMIIDHRLTGKDAVGQVCCWPKCDGLSCGKWLDRSNA